MPRSLKTFFWMLPCLVLGTLLYRVFSHENFLRGVDAYYYALEADSWAATGQVKIPDGSWTHRIHGLLIWAHFSAENAIKLWSAFSVSAIVMLSAQTFFKQPSFKALLIVGVLSFSPSLLFIAVEFPKNLSALLWFLCCLELLRIEKISTLIPFFLSLFALCFHRSFLPVLILCWGIIFGKNLVSAAASRFKTRNVFWGMGISAVFLGGYFLFFQDPLHFKEWTRLTSGSVQIGFWSLLFEEGLPDAIRIELFLSLVCCAGIAGWKFYLWKSPQQTYEKSELEKQPLTRVTHSKVALAIVLLILSFFPFSSDEALGAGERYALLLVPVLWLGGLNLLQTITAQKFSSRLMLYSGMLALTLFNASPALTRLKINAAHPIRLDPDYPAYEKIVQALAPQKIPMLIAHKTLAYFYKFKTLREAFPYEPENHWNSRRIFRLTYGITADEFFYHSDDTCNFSNGTMQLMPSPNYLLIREDCFEVFRNTLTPQNNEALYEIIYRNKKNVSQKRPAFLLSKHANEEATEFPALPLHEKSND